MTPRAPALEQLIIRSPLSRILTLHRQSAGVWAALDQEDDNS